MCRVPSFKPSQPQPRWFAVVPVLFLDFLVMALPGVDTCLSRANVQDTRTDLLRTVCS